MKFYLITLLLFTVTLSVAQFQQPNYDGIAKIIKVADSPFYYPALMKKYRSDDTTLTVQDYRVLYYGFIYQPEYDPFGIPDYFDSLNYVIRKQKLTKADYEKIIRYELNILAQFPFNLREISLLSHAYEETGQSLKARVTHFRFEQLVKAILSTGDGRSQATAMHVTANSHEYDILNFLGLEYASEQTQGEQTWEFLKVRKNEYGVDGIYFNVKKMLESEFKKLDK